MIERYKMEKQIAPHLYAIKYDVEPAVFANLTEDMKEYWYLEAMMWVKGIKNTTDYQIKHYLDD